MDTSHPTLEHGTVVRWRTRSTVGIGQFDHLDPDGTAHVRAWLPTRSHTIRTTVDRLTPLDALNEAAHDAQRTATLLAGGLR